MTIEADYSRDEWDLILGAPGLIALVIVHAEACGPGEAHRKLLAVLAAIAETRNQGTQSELVQAVTDAVRRGQSPLWPAECPGDLEAVHEWALDGCNQVALVLAQKAPEAEGQAYAHWLLSIARRVLAVAPDKRPQEPLSKAHGELQRIVLAVLTGALDAPSAAEELQSPAPG